MAKILLVEDNEMNREMLTRRLTRRGYEVIVAGDGQKRRADQKSRRAVNIQHVHRYPNRNSPLDEDLNRSHRVDPFLTYMFIEIGAPHVSTTVATDIHAPDNSTDEIPTRTNDAKRSAALTFSLVMHVPVMRKDQPSVGTFRTWTGTA